MAPRFQRARKPEEKEVRRQAILVAARALMGEVGIAGLTLNELARRSRVSKANIYRYYESREEVLLQLWIDEMRDFKTRLEAAFRRARTGDVGSVARALATAFAAREALGELTASVDSELERNLSGEAILRAKLTLASLVSEFASVLHGKLPRLKPDDCAYALTAIATFVVGLWTASHPVPAAREVMQRPELRGMCPDFSEGLERITRVVFKGLGA